MRQIKFRGKRIDDGEWMYGYLADVQEQYGYATINYVFDDGEEYWESCDHVDVNTVGQYTGLHDCNGKEIYEGDILRYTRHNVSGEGIHNETWVHECIVYWDEEKHAFWHRMKLSCGSCSGLLIFKDERAEKEEIEVIGNIHEKKIKP